jgi:hypothetical protein
MKTTLFALFFLCATAALGQSVGGVGAVLNSEVQVIQLPSHALHASQTPLLREQNLLIISSNAEGHGERPLWEVGAKPPVETPLGDVARLLRNQHATARKAVKVLEK